MSARILLLCDDRRGHANTVLDHIDAFRRFSRHQVRTFNPKSMRSSVALDFEDFDVVVIHYSVVPSNPVFISPAFKERLQAFRGLKVEFIQDDYRWVDRAAAAAREIGVDILFTVAPEPAAGRLYDQRLPGVRRVQTLTGYVPEALIGRPIKPLAERTVEVGYRARDLPYWYGTFSREKAWIGRRFLELAPEYGLRCDIALGEHDRIYGDRWVEFLSNCRATLGSESGASIADFDGGAESAVRAYLREHPAAAFEEVHEAVLLPYEGNVTVSVVSPRVFEAASLGTAMIMFPGRYSGVVAAGEHYISLAKDFSNMAEVVEKLRDDALVGAMTARAYADLIQSGRWSYKTFIAQFDDVIDQEARTMRGPARATRWRLARAERSLRVPGLRVRTAQGFQALWTRVFGGDPSMRFPIEYDSQIQKALFALRIVLAESDLRALLRAGRRARMPLDRLLREIMELSLLRRAASGRLQGRPAFAIEAHHDAARKALCFVSVPAGRPETGAGLAAGVASSVVSPGEVEVIEWDHRALGGSIELERPAMSVGIGFKGLESFSLLVRIGREDPSLLERALGPALDGAAATAQGRERGAMTSPGA